MGSGVTAGCVPRLLPRYGLEQLERYDLVGQTKKSARKRTSVLTRTPLLEISLSSKAVAFLSSVAYFFLVNILFARTICAVALAGAVGMVPP